MATYQVTGPDGHKYRVTGPDGATDQQVLGQIDAYAKQTPAPTGAAAIPDSGKPMKPDAPAPKEDVGGQYFNKLPGVLNPLARGAVGLGEAGLAAVTGAAAPFVGIARGEGGRSDNATTGYQPRTEYGKSAIGAVGAGAEKVGKAIDVPGLGMAAPGMQGELSALGRSVPAVARAAGDVTRAVPKPSLPPSIAGAGRGIVDTLRGVPAQQLREEATQSARAALTDVEAQHGAQQAAHLSEANTYEDLRTALQRDIDAGAQAGSRPHLGAQGQTIDTVASKAFQLAENARSEATKPLYAARDAAVEKFDAAGKKIDVSAATAPLKEVLPYLENIPDKKALIEKVLGSLQGKPQTNAPGIVDVRGKPFKTTPVGLSTRELVEADKFVKEIAYSSPTEGYGADVRKLAMDAHKAIDKAIGDAIPEQRIASNEYRNLSKPLETATTRFGDLIQETVGGLGKDAYAKFDKSKLPGQIFTNSNYVDMLEDLLAGGKGTTGPAREAAQKQVSAMYENWLMEQIRGGEAGKTGKGALSQLESKSMRPMGERFPQATEGARRKFEGEVAKEKSMAELASSAEQSRAKAATAAAGKEKVTGLLRSADELAKGDAKQQIEAFNDYRRVLKDSVTRGELSPELFQSTLKLAARAASAQARTDVMRKIAWGVAGLAGVGGAKVAAPMVFGGGSQ